MTVYLRGSTTRPMYQVAKYDEGGHSIMNNSIATNVDVHVITKVALQVDCAPETDILQSTNIPVKARQSSKDEGYNREPLKAYADKPGVYVIHTGKEILYVGKTTKAGLDKRIFRHLLKSASVQKVGDTGRGSKVFECLAEQEANDETLYIYFLNLTEISRRISGGPISLNDNQKVGLMEVALQQLYRPKCNSLIPMQYTARP